MVARSLSSSSDISVLIDPDTILLADFLSTLTNAHKLDEDWLLVASSRNVSNFPFGLGSDGKNWLGDDGKRAVIQKVCWSLVHLLVGSHLRDLILNYLLTSVAGISSSGILIQTMWRKNAYSLEQWRSPTS